MSSGLADYTEGRDFPARPNVSRLSPYLQTGELSPNQVWYAVEDSAADENTQKFRSEIAWREFSYNLLWQHPNLHKDNIQAKFDRFPWKNSNAELKAWQRGQTGIPIVDAGMRELWHTGYMHNRMRMIAASFLVKNLRIDWRHGEAWFWDKLVDADPASNAASWQWVAGCGADAAPYFRVFNPITQAKKFDPTRAYIHKWVPELRDTSVHDLLSRASNGDGSQGQYPKPLVDLKSSREMALNAFARLKAEQ